MGTRAAFWVGDPRNLEQREWLGCIAWDGYPDGNPEPLRHVVSEAGFRHIVGQIATEQGKKFAAPHLGWPFPWADDIFLTDYTYAWIDGKVMVACYHHTFRPMAVYFSPEQPDEDEEYQDDPTMLHVPAPAAYNPEQPDSIMIISVRGSQP